MTVTQTLLIIQHGSLKPNVHQHNKAYPQANTFHPLSRFVIWPESSKGISSIYIKSLFRIGCLFASWCCLFPHLSTFGLSVVSLVSSQRNLSCAQSDREWVHNTYLPLTGRLTNNLYTRSLRLCSVYPCPHFRSEEECDTVGHPDFQNLMWKREMWQTLKSPRSLFSASLGNPLCLMEKRQKMLVRREK